jgi:hypothetical protein
MKETVTVEALTSQMTPMKTIRSTLVSDNLAVVLDILMLQDKHNIHVCTLSLNIKLIALAVKQARKARLRLTFTTHF